MSCYLTTGKHMGFYLSFGTVLLLLAIAAPTALLFGFGGAMAARAHFAPLSWLGRSYIAVVRGVPDIAFSCSLLSLWIRASNICVIR